MPMAGLAPDATAHLVIPPPAVARHPETLVKPRELKGWLNDLPKTDPLMLAEQLHRQLKLLVRDPERELRYADLLALYHPDLQRLQNQVWGVLVGARHRVKKQEQLRATVSQLMLEIACGHMRMVRQALSDGKNPAGENIYHAVLPLCRLMQWDLLQYNLTRPSIWRQVLQLFALGELHLINDSEQKSQLTLAHDAATTHGVFFSTLILLLSDPYRLVKESVASLEQSLGELAEFLRINDSGEANYRIAIDLSGRLPPLRHARQSTVASEQSHFLQLDEFFIQIDRQGLPQDDGTLARWLIDTLRELALKPNGREARRHERQKREADYHFVHSLDKVYQRLNEIQTGQRSEQQSDNRSGIILDDEKTLPSIELGIPCRQLDQSVCGAGFMLSPETQIPPVGSWVLFEADEQHQGGRGFIGQIRRCLKFDDQGTEIGVEKLRGSVVPVTLGLDNRPGLLHVNRENKHCQLVAPLGTFRQAGQHTLHGNGKDYRVNFEALLESDFAERIRISLD